MFIVTVEENLKIKLSRNVKLKTATLGTFHPLNLLKHGVVKQNNKSIQNTTRTMILEYNLSNYFWVEAVSIACHILNRCLIRKILKKTPYDIWRGKKTNISYFNSFRCNYFLPKNSKNNLGKFDPQSDNIFFLGTLPLVELVEHIINKLSMLKNLCILYLMKIITPLWVRFLMKNR